MKYVTGTILIVALCIIYTSFLTGLRFIFPWFNVVYVCLFAYYISRESKLSLYLFFIGGIFLDIFTISQVGFTSANFFISLLIYALLTRIFPAERSGKLLSLLVSSTCFYLISYITLNFITNHGIAGLLLYIPWGIASALCIFFLSFTISFLFPVNHERKISIG